MTTKLKSKKVLLMTQYFYPEYVSSAVMPFETASYLATKGIDVSVLCGYPYEYSNKMNVPLHENVDNVVIDRIKYAGVKRTGVLGRIANYFTFYISILRKIKQLNGYDVVIVYSDPPILPLLAEQIKKKLRAKVIYVCYDVYPEIGIRTNKYSERSVFFSVFNYINRKIFKSIDYVVVLSSDMKEYIEKNRNVDGEKIGVIRNWGKNRKLTNVRSEILSDINDDTFVVSYLGNMGVCQDVDTIMEAIKNIENNGNTCVIFAGHGSKMKDIEKDIHAGNITCVKQFGFLQGEDFDAVLQRSDAFIFSLIPRMVGLCSPSKVCDYLSSGKPVIFIGDCDIEIAKDIVEYNCGFQIDNDDCEGVIECIKLLKSNKSMRELMGRNSKKLFNDKYCKELSLPAYREIVEKI